MLLNVNTNISNTQEDHEDMLAQGEAAAYFHLWKFKITRLTKGGESKPLSE